jgi:hypothetical protein
MPSDETRRILKLFGVAVTNYEDAVESGATSEAIQKAEADVNVGLGEVNALIERLRARTNTLS